MGVFATRSPFRPNPVGLSSVQLDSVELHTDRGPVLHVSGADLMDGTPIYDIKPYLAFADSHPDALGGFTDQTRKYGLSVEIPEMLLERIEEKKRESLKAVLAHDPRPSYQDDRSGYTAWNLQDMKLNLWWKTGSSGSRILSSAES